MELIVKALRNSSLLPNTAEKQPQGNASDGFLCQPLHLPALTASSAIASAQTGEQQLAR